MPVSTFWNERYKSNPHCFGTEPSPFLEENVHLFDKDWKVFVPGDGYGRNSLWLARQEFEVKMVEHSTVGLELARESAKREKLDIVCEFGDFSEYIPEPFDAAAVFYVHMDPAGREFFHKNLAQALRPGGIIILEGFTPAQRLNNRTSGGPQQIEKMFTPEILRANFRDLEISYLEELTIEAREGQQHSGTKDIIRMIAKRPLT